jgi:hypothetical protein
LLNKELMTSRELPKLSKKHLRPPMPRLLPQIRLRISRLKPPQPKQDPRLTSRLLRQISRPIKRSSRSKELPMRLD